MPPQVHDQLHHNMSQPKAPIEKTTNLTHDGIQHTLEKTAPSITLATPQAQPQLAELDASKLTFIRNRNPKKVPAPHSPEVWSQSV